MNRGLVVAFAALCCTAACEEKKPEINGIGDWVLGKTTLAQAPGVCSKDDVTFCSHNGTIAIGDTLAEVNLYFGGREDSAKLVEIELGVRRCDPEPLAVALSDALGKPSSRMPDKLLWEHELAFVSADFKAGARRCQVNFVSPGDKKRVAELSAPRGAN